MKYEKWLEILNVINADSELNSSNVIEKIKDKLRIADSGIYAEWREAFFDINYLFKVTYCQGNDYQTLVCLVARSGCTDIVKALIDKEIDFDKPDTYGSTPLLLAVLGRHIEIIKALINKNININKANRWGYTPLLVAVEGNHLDIVKYLMKHVADVNITNDDGMTPLHFAADYGHLQIVEYLLKHGADVNVTDGYGMTPLHIAAKHGYLQIVEYLLKHGADVNVTTDEGDTTPLELAIRNVEEYDYEEDRYNDIKLIIQRLKHHIIKLKTAGLYVSEKNLSLIHYGNDYLDDIYMEDIQFECKKEFEAMKSHKLHNDISIYDILVKYRNPNRNPTYIQNENMVQALESLDCNEFPMYGSLIKNIFKRDKQKSELLTIGKKWFNILTKISNVLNQNILPILQVELVENIFSYLDNRDLKNLILCGEDIESKLKNKDSSNSNALEAGPSTFLEDTSVSGRIRRLGLET